MESPTLTPNGIDGETGAPFFPPMRLRELREMVRGALPPPFHASDLRWRAEVARQRLLSVLAVDPNDLAETGWGVVFPKGLDPEIQTVLRPLLALRQQQAGGLFRELTWSGEPKPLFQALHGAGPGPVDPRRLPYYLLLVGGPEEVPFEFQYQMDVQYAVGRLAFDGPHRLAQYASYARSVVAAEEGTVALPRRAVLFAPANPEDATTVRLCNSLVRPLARELADFGESGKHRCEIHTVLGPDAGKEALRRLLGKDRPALLLTATHGMAFPCGHPRQRREQGSLLCQDWGEPGRGISPSASLSAEDLREDVVPAGLVAFHFACFSAATPAVDGFAHRTEGPPRPLAPNPFIAGLPQRLLSHPGGSALAVVGHIDRAWTYSFDWPLAGQQTAVFADTLLQLLQGHRIGQAMEPFNQRYAELATLLQSQPDGGEEEALLRTTALWTALLDARNYAVLGDPAVRLSFPHSPSPP